MLKSGKGEKRVEKRWKTEDKGGKKVRKVGTKEKRVKK